tara:strand:- start:651 stop:1058 length:408 start_codon:yes stop_codon:yes gene_type:complete
MSSFADQIRAFEDSTNAKMERAARKIILDAFSEVILVTPVDKGTARANWQVAIGNVPNGTLELNDETGTATISKVAAEAQGLELGDTIYLANNLPYINRIMNEGWSGQAPAGSFDLIVQRFNVIAGKVIAQIGAE